MEADDSEAVAIRALLDDYDASEALEWLSPLDDVPEIPVTSAGSTPLTTDSDSSLGASTATGAIVTRQSHTAPLSGTGKPRAKQVDPNKARSERRLELIHLRRQAAELESHLDGLRSDGRRRWSSLDIASDAQSTQASLRIVDKLYPSQRFTTQWEELARGERTKRLRAEMKNTRLRLLVGSHVKTANQLRRILVPKRPRNACSDMKACLQDGIRTDYSGVMASIPVPTSVVTVHPSPPSFSGISGLSSAQIFDMLKESVTCAHRGMDGLFIANGLATMEKAYRSAKVEQDNAHQATMELMASKSLPYDMESTRRAVWHHFVDLYSKMPDRASFQYRDEQKSVEANGVDEMLAESYHIELGNGIVSGTFNEWRVLQQFEESDRIVIIYCIVSEAADFASKPASGIRILKQVYIILRRPSRSPDIEEGGDPTSGSTLLQFFYRFQPTMYKTTPGLAHTFAALTDFLFGFIGGRISINYQMIEQDLQATTGL